ncbi:tRNA lysidine(34) synthetase TilS [Nocardioides panacisoli]|uniref:tRNA lysidine(34) synthetase TilS n=1 Tax=Nocardioides panacisoli TaxID=627624 RepID=UPI001C629B94|nr:tRNA lysidine(34) synthetase TilS [Nocardioides panacisoli]QYJ03721.1 tRNA lysidine(34) synthetase TilS [Nocardioides panacisoli]
MALPPAVAACRHGVRRSVADLPPGQTVLVACSGGPDSTALAAAAVHEGRRAGLRVVGVTVDHGLQDGSAARAEQVREQLLALGCAEAYAVPVTVAAVGDGPEGAARRARYAALDRLADDLGAACVLVGHTRDDQAETVLLGLARGSGPRAVAGMAAQRGRVRRPLLDVPRVDTLAACAAAGLETWHDPHNDDPAFARVRVRRHLLPALEAQLGPGVADALARTAGLVREDAEALDALARAAYDRLQVPAGPTAAAGAGGRACRDPAVGLAVAELLEQPRAVATRVLRLAAVDAGAIDGELSHVHVRALWDLATGEVRGEVQLPGHLSARRDGGAIRLTRTDVPS